MIVYDFETSSRELIGQVLSYSFIVVNAQLEITEELSGLIRLNRIQLPEIEAILVNRINLEHHQAQAEFEYVAAKKIFQFLSNKTQEYGYIPLVGFNSNSFDLPFLRNLLIRYGYNPYMNGKLTNLDVLHFSQYLAFLHPDQFPWFLHHNDLGIPYYSFKLDYLSRQFHLLDTPQTHDAREDVLLVIALLKKFKKEYGQSIQHFQPVQLIGSTVSQPIFEVAKQKVLDYPDTTDKLPEKIKYRYWLNICSSKKEYIVLDLEKYDQGIPLIDCLKYINPNKHFFCLEPLAASEQDRFSLTIAKARSDSFLCSLTSDNYFELIQKDWDIEYQIHMLGFKRIDLLKPLVDQLLKDPNTYQDSLTRLLKNRQDKKDNYLIQLFNRVYLNYHPQVNVTHLHKYLLKRYVTGDLLKDPQRFQSLSAYQVTLEQYLSDPALSNADQTILLSLKAYFMDFCQRNELISFL